MERIEAYEVVREIARGGSATVYEARQPALDRTVALKRLDLRTNDPALVERFIRESRIAASFDHPNIVTVFDFFEHDGVPHIAMEYLPRGSLRPWMRHLTLPQSIGVLEGILAALAHAEQRGIAHRDLKPENVLISERGTVKIADFGIAKAYTQATEGLTAAGTSIGTPVYMAPEQARNEAVGPFTDLYAVGVMAFEMLSGSPPFQGESSVATLYRHVNEPPPPLDGLDPRIAAWVGRLLAKDPADRPAGAAAAWSALEEIAVDDMGPYWRRDALLLEPGDEAPAEPPAAAAVAAPTATAPRATAATVAAPRTAPEWRPRLVPVLVALVALALGTVAVIALAGGRDEGSGSDPASPPATSEAVAPYDFEGDGRSAFAIGMPGWRQTGAAARGGVALLGLQRVMTRASLGLPGGGRADAFGSAVASADFDRDGHADLAVGAPGHNVDDRARREGAVTVVSGSPDGLVQTTADSFDGPGIDLPYRNALYGSALAAGDLNGDGYADLAVGAPGGDALPAEERGSGAIQLLFGGPNGLDPAGARSLRRPRSGMGRFGSALAIGDVDRDGHADLVEGAPGDAALSAPGHVSFCPGAAKGPTACRTLGGFEGAGAAVVAVGDVTGDHFPDIVAGVPGRGAAGALLMWRGGRRGPAGAPAEITQQSPGIRGHDQAGDLFGAALALTDLDRDGFTDLVVGAPGEDEGAGRVTLAFGGPDGLVPEGGRVYSEGERGLPGTKRPGQHFGAALGVLDTNDDGRPELCVAVPAGRGTVVTLPGFDGGFARAGSSAFSLARLRDGRPARDEELHIGG